ncbi:nuclear transport factor 2 family protein [Modestobacter sp. SSW1-42]|uniref:nuclear transport factor 2 family protein n=1 Tax=Modestobacter sp. SSW1-42 TaxID=596372 RepID=UPI003987E267
MSWIDTPPGTDPNHARVFARRPEVLAAWQQLNGAIKAQMDPRRYELATVAAALRLRCSYCALAHGQVLAEQHLDDAAVVALVRDPRAAGLTDAEVAVVELADRVAAGAATMQRPDVARARAAGLSDDDVLDVVLAASARMFFSSVLDATGTLPDAGYAALPTALRDALTVGRPIEGEDAATARDTDRVAALYEALAARDVDRLMAGFAPDVDWPDVLQGGRVRGAAAVRSHWLEQWAVTVAETVPRRVRELPDGRVEVLVQQTVRDLDGDLLGGATVLHTYTLRGGLITRMDVGDPLDDL